MKNLHLTLSPDFLDGYEDFLLNEANLSEFFNCIGAICFNDYCTFYYSAQQYRGLLSFMETMDFMEHERRFLRLLDSENVEEASNENVGGSLFKYLGFGVFPIIERSEAAKAIYEMENVALIDFTKKDNRHRTIQIILDVENKLKAPKEWAVLSTYTAFLNWSLQLNPRNFDESMNAKHPPDGRKGFGSSLLCSEEEVKKVLQIAFFKNSHHENHLFFYHFPKETTAILWLKTSARSLHFHGFHISKDEAQKKGIDIDALENYSKYLESQGLT